MPLSQYNQVIVRVWTSKDNVNLPGQDVGHVSLEIGTDLDPTNKRYISFWPKNPVDDPRRNSIPGTVAAALTTEGMFRPAPGEYKLDLNEDINAEGRDPESTIVLYSLDTKKMIKKFDAEKTKTKGWAAAGNNCLFRAHSCASMAYTILIAGKIKDLLATTTPSQPRLSSVTTPDKLVEAIQEAKQAEYDKHRGTRDFDSLPVDNGNDSWWWPCQLL